MTTSRTAASTSKKILWVTVFGFAMAYMEAAVVVYLRMIFYPQGFDFPLSPGPPSTILIELGREAATILMLIAIAFLSGRTRIERFAYLIYTFGIWDIMYYVWLQIQIGWPASLLTWDLLFLLPVPWVGPVIAPILVSVAMIWAGLWVIRKEEQGMTPSFPRWAWWLEILAGLVIIASFIWDAGNVALGGYPDPFRWDIFALGLVGGIFLFIMMMRHPRNRTARGAA